MKKPLIALLCAALLTPFAALFARAEGADANDAPAEWTVLFYLCGSDLESRFGYASENLREIGEVHSPDEYAAYQAAADDGLSGVGAIGQTGTVNVLIETGGSREWHAQDLDMDVDPASLQRWRYRAYSLSAYDEAESGSFALEQTLPLASMADPATLSDFIRWGVETCPAEKYALVLWDHGGGAKTGLFIDELHDNAFMDLSQLRQALADGGAAFEAVLIDACMMANLETAVALQDSARWMIASEESVPGNGTAMKEWLQELLNNPGIDGERLGRNICDMTQMKYANKPSLMTQSLLTWSVIDLSKLGRVTAAFDSFARFLCDTYVDDPFLMYSCAQILRDSESYGAPEEGMRDLAAPFYNDTSVYFMDRALRSEMQTALADAVAYCVRGAGRAAARGLSFCYCPDFSGAELDAYARNCFSPHYLALLDAINEEWSAPGWIYEAADGPSRLETPEDYQTVFFLSIDDNGVPGILLMDDFSVNISGVYYRLYHLDEASGNVECLGRTNCFPSIVEDELFYSASEPMLWPHLEGAPCCANLVGGNSEYDLYNIPIQMGSDVMNLRCGRVFDQNADQRLESSYRGESVDTGSIYTVYGLWDGYDNDSQVMGRNVKLLSEVFGREYSLLFPLDVGGYETGVTQQMYRSLVVAEQPLPPGTYYLEYEVEDMFMRPRLLDRLELLWDGENMVFSYDEGSVWELALG